MSTGNNREAEKRRRYVNAFNGTMLNIWRERMRLLGVFDTGALYNSLLATRCVMDQDATEFTVGQQFNAYGIYVDAGTGSNTTRGNSGDLGEGFVNRRKRRRWFSPKYYASVMKIQEFFAQSLGEDGCMALCNALTRESAARTASGVS